MGDYFHMRDLYYMELRDRCREVRQMEESGDSPEKNQELAEAVHYVVWLSELARREGLLELEEEIMTSDKPFVKQELWPMMDLVIAGAA